MPQSIPNGLPPAPPFTIAAALLIWGWQTEFLVFALPMIILIEMSHWLAWRWPISNREFNIVSDLSGVIFFIVVVYIFTSYGAKGIFTILSIVPFILFLLVVLQQYSEQGRIKVSALFVSLRRLDPKTSPEADAEVDLSLPYIVLCIVAASAGNQRSIWFFILSFLLFSLLLWTWRPKRYPVALWAGMLILTFMLAYAGQGGIRQVQRSIEASIVGLVDQFMWRYRDPERATTSMGTIGRLKLSDRIVMRIDPDQDLEKSLLLAEASYQKYHYGVWSNPESTYTLIDPELSGTAWTLTEAQPDKSVAVSVYMPTEIGVIPLPHGTTAVRNVSAIEINQSAYGTVKMEIREGWIKYLADYGNSVPADIFPATADLDVVEDYRPVFTRLANELDLYGKPESEAVAIIEDFFAENFHYTLTQNARFPRGRYLENFLFNSREGHCEFFATSTVLLLRTIGIPARYVAGYAVSEYSPIEGQYVARSRDAHSWVMAYIDKSWRIIDTTPVIWAAVDEENASLYQPLLDLVSWVSYRVALFQSRDELEEETSYDYLLYLLIPLILLLVWRLYFKQRIRHNVTLNRNNRIRDYPGMDSPLYDLIRELNRNGYVRREGETLSAWLKRVNSASTILDLEEALQLHYRYRFDPQGCKPEVKNRILSIVQSISGSALTPASAELTKL